MPNKLQHVYQLPQKLFCLFGVFEAYETQGRQAKKYHELCTEVGFAIFLSGRFIN